MPPTATVLLLTATWLGFLHTLIGPDHYLPFIVMARSQHWSTVRTFWVTLLCGMGHVLSSVVLGLIGAVLGLAAERLMGIEQVRGTWAAWGLIAFGLLYCIYGLRAAARGQTHTHIHGHLGSPSHTHEHNHTGEHSHAHAEGNPTANMTPWVLFVVFVLGPCEPLIPLVMYPALQHNWALMCSVALVFSVITVGMMLLIVLVSVKGLSLVRLGSMERYSHALAGFAIFASGMAIVFLKL